MQFDDVFFNEVGLASLSNERKAELSQQLAELAEDQLSLVLAERLTDKQLEHFNELDESDGGNVALAYLQDLVPDYEELVVAQTQAVKQAFVNDMGMLLDLEKEAPTA